MCFAPQRRAIFHSHLARWLRTRPFSEPTFRPSGATNHWKKAMFRDFPTFSRTCIFFSDSFSSLIFSLLLFSSLFFCFSSVHTVGSLTSKLPSIKLIYILYIMYMCMYTTSSTAQGGGGSFKNRKPIGEVGCCESRMAERIRWWTERWLKLCFWSGCNGCSGHITHNCCI